MSSCVCIQFRVVSLFTQSFRIVIIRLTRKCGEGSLTEGLVASEQQQREKDLDRLSEPTQVFAHDCQGMEKLQGWWDVSWRRAL